MYEKSSIKSITENGIETILHSIIPVEPEQLRDIFRFAYTRMPLLSELEKRIDEEVVLEFVHFSDIDACIRRS